MRTHKKPRLFYGFTLVELIVVISVLAILATIAFTQISNVTLSARNSTRMTNLQSISSSLNLYIATNGVYPIPDNKTDILYSGSIIGYQGYIKDTAARMLKLSPSSSQDPLNTSSYFSYATNASRTDMQLLGFLEKDTSTGLKALPTTFASDELSTKTPYSKGEELGILYTSWTATPLSGTGVDVSTTTSTYTAYYNSTDSLSGTGTALQNLLISYSYGAGYGSPATDDCPTGFIPVPWNKDFNQPGFCVAKYEMKQAVGDAGSYAYSGTWTQRWDQVNPYCTETAKCNSTSTRNFTNQIISKAEWSPICNINQYQAIEACKAMGAGYHLITNNEWMAIARNIEKVDANWSKSLVGSGYIYNGHVGDYPNYILPASTNDADNLFGITGNKTCNTSWCNNKRALLLSNGSVIWDLSGNLWEHVNKANTLDGTGYMSGQTSVSGCYAPASFSDWNTCTNKTWGPSNTAYTAAGNGVGQIYYGQWAASNILLRGWNYNNTSYSWIYTMLLHWFKEDASGNTGFRCAK